MILDNKYGYKVCYEEYKNNKLKLHLVTNSFDLAVLELKNYKLYPQKDRKDKHVIKNPIWHLLEVKNQNEYKRLWKGCPFADDLS